MCVCVCLVCILYCYTISWNFPMVFAYSLTQLAPFSLGLHSSSKLSSPEQHPWSVILQGMQRTLSIKVVSFSSVWFMHCKFTSVTWYRFLLTIYTIGELLSTFEVRWRKTLRFPLNRTSGGNSFTASFTSLRCTISARIPPDACLAVRQSHPEKLGDAGMSPKMPGGKLKFKRFMVGCRFKLEWSFLVLIGGWGRGIELSNSPILRVH